MSKPEVISITKTELTGIALSEVRAVFDNKYQPKMKPIPDGAGRGRDGLEDGWITGLEGNLWIDGADEHMHPVLYDAIACIREPGQTIARAAFNWLRPHAVLKRHVDGAPYYSRWHLVLEGSYEYTQEYAPGLSQSHTFETGNWYGPISYWVPHSVRNFELPRLTMIVDLEQH